MAKFFWQRQRADDGEEKFALPDELEKKLDAGAKAAEELPKITQLLEDMKSTQASKDAADKKAKEDAAAAAARRQREEANTDLEERIEALMLEGKTKEAIKLATSDQTMAIKAVHADNVRRELFEDADKFKYYHGDIKREVDSLIANQAVDFRMNPANLENCYNTVVGKHTSEILEGKLKTRFAGSDGGSRTSTGSAGDSGAGKKDLQITDDIKKLAKEFGVRPEDYAEMLDKEGIGYV